MSTFPDSEATIFDLQRMLETYRSTLAHYLHQKAELGSLTPPGISNGIKDARLNIEIIKNSLKNQGIEVHDHPFDKDEAEDYKSKFLPAKLSSHDKLLLKSLCFKTALFSVACLCSTAFIAGYILDATQYSGSPPASLTTTQLSLFLGSNIFNSIALAWFVTRSLRTIDGTFGAMQGIIFGIGRIVSITFPQLIYIISAVVIFFMFRLKERPISFEKTVMAALGYVAFHFLYSTLLLLLGQISGSLFRTNNLNDVIGYKFFGTIVGVIQGIMFAYVAAGAMYWQTIRHKIDTN